MKVEVFYMVKNREFDIINALCEWQGFVVEPKFDPQRCRGIPNPIIVFEQKDYDFFRFINLIQERGLIRI